MKSVWVAGTCVGSTVGEGTAGLGSIIGGLGVIVVSSVGETCFELHAWRVRRTRKKKARRFSISSFPEANIRKHIVSLFMGKSQDTLSQAAEGSGGVMGAAAPIMAFSLEEPRSLLWGSSSKPMDVERDLGFQGIVGYRRKLSNDFLFYAWGQEGFVQGGSAYIRQLFN